jgi:hypothetical protein
VRRARPCAHDQSRALAGINIEACRGTMRVTACAGLKRFTQRH